MSDKWSDDRRQTAYIEARAVVEAQNDTMMDIDDKAMRSVRLGAVLVGLLLAGLQVDPGLFDRQLLTLALFLLVGAVLAGIATYDESDLYIGPQGEYIEEVATDADYRPSWDRDILRMYAGMISENFDNINRNARGLRTTNSFLVTGILAAVLAVAIWGLPPYFRP